MKDSLPYLSRKDNRVKWSNFHRSRVVMKGVFQSGSVCWFKVILWMSHRWMLMKAAVAVELVSIDQVDGLVFGGSISAVSPSAKRS